MCNLSIKFPFFSFLFYICSADFVICANIFQLLTKSLELYLPYNQALLIADKIRYVLFTAKVYDKSFERLLRNRTPASGCCCSYENCRVPGGLQPYFEKGTLSKKKIRSMDSPGICNMKKGFLFFTDWYTATNRYHNSFFFLSFLLFLLTRFLLMSWYGWA